MSEVLQPNEGLDLQLTPELISLETRLKLQATLNCLKKQPQEKERLLKVEAVNERAADFNIYDTDRLDDIHPESALTFHPSPETFTLPENVDLEGYGQAIQEYYWACKQLILDLPKNHRWLHYLNHSKPQWMLDMEDKEVRGHAFLRPDLILTEGHPVVSEIESSPFGLALSHFLEKAYKEDSDEDEVLAIIAEELTQGKTGSYAIVYSDHTAKYQGQLEYLANELQKRGINIEAVKDSDITEDYDGIYRGFYLHEAVHNPRLQELLEDTHVLPPVAPRLEEKALMGMMFDPEFEDYFKQMAGFETLKNIMPKTWVLSEDNVPEEFDSWDDLVNMSRRQRQYVLKISGFSDDGSWGRGVTFLSRLSKEDCARAIKEAMESDATYIIQEFKKGSKFEHPYFDFNAEEIKTMKGKVRCTPYYSVRDGSLLTAKTTMCENTDFIHAMTHSINVPTT